MITPTDDQINKICAEVCGWTNIIAGRYGETLIGTEPDGCQSEIPGYCTDRNELPELLSRVYDSDHDVPQMNEFNRCIRDYPIPPLLRYLPSWDMHILLLSPRSICITILRALGRWPEDWSIE